MNTEEKKDLTHKNEQVRTVVTHRCILKATDLFLQQNPASKLTTNKIARVAGVSIGSVYNHFKNKDEILIELINNQLDEDLITYGNFFNDESKRETIEEEFHKFLKVVLDNYRRNIELRRLIIFYKRHPSVEKKFVYVNRATQTLIEDHFYQSSEIKSELPIDIIVSSLRGVIRYYLEFCPEKFGSFELDRELDILISSYIKNSHLIDRHD
ncbi:TetR/AcrR family transcriptional regulator [Halobacteriovorax sp. RZ-1]|uniref:TetR/AcrR family transcriptional regulator n=1 Tax=unclassified Halobacteriovorax TaxID=2639665 RepID=UPI00371D9C11